MRVSSRVLCFAMTCALGCAGAKPRARAPQAPRNDNEHAYVDGVQLAPDGDNQAPAALVGRESDGARDLVSGAMRYQVSDQGARAASDAMGTAILHAVPFAGAWYFVSREGLVVRSATFLGPLSPVTQLDSTRVHSTIALGNTLTFTSDTHVVTVSSAGQVRSVPLHEDVLARRAAFADDGRGWLIDQRGEAWSYAPGDGGAWQPADLHGAAAYEMVSREPATLAIATSEGMVSPDSTGALARTGDVNPLEVQRAVDLQHGALPAASDEDRAAVTRVRSLRTCRLEHRLLPHADGTAWCVHGKEGELGRDALVFDPRTREVVRIVPNAVPEADCVQRDWGAARAVFACPSGAVYSTRDGERYDTLIPAGKLRVLVPNDLVLSDDGEHAMYWNRDCGDKEHPYPQWVCSYTEGKGWRSERVPEIPNAPTSETDNTAEDINPHELVGQHMLRTTHASKEVAMHGTLVAFKIEDNDTAKVWNGSSFLDVPLGDLHPQDMAWTADGSLAFTAQRTDDEGPAFQLLIWNPETNAAIQHTLPEDALFALMLNRAHGFAMSADSRQFWETLNSGATWREMESPFKGSGAHDWTQHSVHDPWGDLDYDLVVARCREGACTVTGLMTDITMGHVRAEPGLYGDLWTRKETPNTTVGDEVYKDEQDRSHGHASVTCDNNAHVPALATRAWSAQSSATRVQRAMGNVATPFATLALPTDPRVTVTVLGAPGGTSVQLQWSVMLNAQRIARTSLAGTLVGVESLAQERGDDVQWRWLDATPDAVVAERCTRDRCHVFLAQSGSAPVQLDVSPTWGNVFVERERVHSARVMQDRGVMVFALGTREADGEFVLSARFAPDGAPRGHRSFFFHDDADTRVTGTYERRMGVGYRSHEGVFWWAALEDDMAAPMRRVREHVDTVGPCTPGETALEQFEPIRLLESAQTRVWMDNGSKESRLLQQPLALTPHGLCWRSLTQWVTYPMDGQNDESPNPPPAGIASVLRVQTQTDGALRASIVHTPAYSGFHGVTCKVVADYREVGDH